MTREQLIVLGFIAGAFLAGWLTHALVGLANRGLVDEDEEWRPGSGTPQRFAGAVHESRRELDRAILSYHAAVAVSLTEVNGDGSREGTLKMLARALFALAAAVDQATGELELEDPLLERFQLTGIELRLLAQDVMLHSSERELPGGVLDRLEQNLMSAASTILRSDHLQAQVV